MRGAGDFEVLRPATLEDAAGLLQRPHAMLVAGGTDLLPNLRRGLHAPRWLVDLSGLHAHSGFERCSRDAAGWHLGAGLRLADIARDATLAAALPALVQAAREVAGPGHRSAATLGGNLCQDTRCVYYNQSAWWRAANDHCLKRDGDTCHVAPQGRRCHAAYQGDLAAALLAYGAEVEIVGIENRRRLPLQRLYRDDGAAHLTLATGELVGAVHVPAPSPGSVGGYRKLRARAAMDFPLAGVAIVLRLDRGRLAELNVGVSGTDTRPLRIEGTEALLGHAVDETTAQSLARLVRKQVGPMRSTATPGNHRRLVAAAAAARLLLELAQTAPAHA